MRKLFRFVNDDRIVKGRTWWPLPQALSVAPHLESVREEGSAVEGLSLSSSKKCSTRRQQTPRAEGFELPRHSNTEHFFARNGISTEHARSASGARLYSVLVCISESGRF